MLNKKYFQNLDYILIGVVTILSVFGLVVITSATRVNLGQDTTIVLKQLLFFIFGLVLMIISANIDYKELTKFNSLIYIGNIGLLILVLLIGNNVNGATRWISIGSVITLQPSEFTKILMIFFLATTLSKNKNKINNLLFLIIMSISVIIPILLIQLQPSLSASLVLVTIFIIQVYITGISYKIIFHILMIVLPIVFFIFYDVSKEVPLLLDKILLPHQFNRILSFLDPTRDPSLYYQTEKSISAIGSGEVWGKGLYNGTLNQLSYLPEPHNDFIFSVIGEEFGFIGCILTLGLLLFITFRCIVIATTIRDLLSQLIASGVAGMIAFQTFINAGVALGLVPNTGMSLPFVGYGGSAMWTNMIAIGLVLNIKRTNSKSLFEGGLI